MNTIHPPLWRIWENPVLRRYMAARLRWKSLIPALLVTQILAGFLWLVTYFATLRLTGETHRFDRSMKALADAGMGNIDFTQKQMLAAVSAWIAVLVIQGLLWMVKGTFAVAVGVARESGEGMIDAHRLTPLPVAHKVLGQLLGLPIRETVLVLSLLPWVWASFAIGHLPISMFFRVYLLLASSAILHHGIGLVAGMVIPHKILAGTLSQALVILLHYILPMLNTVGIGPIAHLSVEPAIISEIARGVPAYHPGEMIARVAFFSGHVSVAGYQWAVTMVFLVFLIAILVRRWIDEDSQLLGKLGTALMAAWLLLLAVAELTPRLQSGGVVALVEDFYNGAQFANQPVWMTLVWCAMTGSVLLLVLLVLVTGITPTLKLRIRTLRQLGRDGQRTIPFGADGRFALPWVLAIGGFGACAWITLVDAAFASVPELAGHRASAHPFVFVASILAPLVCWHSLLAWRGLKTAAILGLLLGLGPLMAAIISPLAMGRFPEWVQWLGGMSGLALPAAATFQHGSALLHLPKGVALAPVFPVSLTIHVLVALWCIIRGHQHHRALASSAGGPSMQKNLESHVKVPPLPSSSRAIVGRSL